MHARVVSAGSVRTDLSLSQAAGHEVSRVHLECNEPDYVLGSTQLTGHDTCVLLLAVSGVLHASCAICDAVVKPPAPM